jgi:2-hydroxyacyl-CoA lyase 1
MAEAFGGIGHMCRTQDEIGKCLRDALKQRTQFTLLNVIISPDAERKPQTHAWLTRSKI